MECDVCGKDNATIFLTQVIEGKVQKVNLCEVCAAQKGVTDPTGFDLAELLKGMGQESVQTKSSRGLICKACGFSQSDFKKTGRMGCSECYRVFAESLEGLLNAMHKGNSHIGKIPHYLESQSRQRQLDEIEQLQKRLADSIEKENYEEAARIRDRLRQLEAKAVETKS